MSHATSKMIAPIMLCLFTMNAATTATSSVSPFNDTTKNGSKQATNERNSNQNIVLMLTSHRNSGNSGNSGRSSSQEQLYQHHQNISFMENSNEDLNLNKFNFVATTPRIIIPSTEPPNR